jgi:hypothetical protein
MAMDIVNAFKLSKRLMGFTTDSGAKMQNAKCGQGREDVKCDVASAGIAKRK